MSMIWFTADQHFGHTNIIKYCKRPFSSVEEMNEVLISNFNSKVGKKDTTYHLGDFTFIRDAYKFLDNLNGKHVLIRGNHDRKHPQGWDFIYTTHIVEGIFLSHYAHRVWPKSHHKAVHLYGHSHGTLAGINNSMDIGVDTNNFYPYSIEDIKERFNQ